MKKYVVVFYNRFAQKTQTFKVLAKNEYRAGRLFYLKHNRKAYHGCIENITEVRDHFWTEEEIKAFVAKRN